jgi:single-stranded-DNA-specific exonuclease
MKDNEIFEKYGGHKGAAGCTVKPDKIRLFMRYFDDIVKEILDKEDSVSGKEYDTEMPISYITDQVYDIIRTVAPFGRGFEQPIFKAEVVLLNHRYVGDPAIHTIVEFTNKERTHTFKAFYPKSSSVAFSRYRNKLVTILYSIDRKNDKIEPIIHYLTK